MWLRRQNVTVNLYWKGPWNEVLAVAQAIDNALQNNREIAPLGTFDPLPEIVDGGLPATLIVRPMISVMPDGQRRRVPTRSSFEEKKRATLRFTPEFRGLGPVENIRFKVTVEGLGHNEVRQDGRTLQHVKVPEEGNRYKTRATSTENDGRFILHLSVPDQPTTRKVTMIAANEDNVIVTKEIEVQIVPEV